MRDYRPEDFADAVGGDFIVAGTDPALVLTLDAVKPLAQSLRAGGGFSLDFTGPCDPVIPQGTLGLRLGDVEHVIFVVAVARDDAGVRYQAVFN
jgi:hypothetical protein